MIRNAVKGCTLFQRRRCGSLFYGTVEENQLRTLSHIGIFKKELIKQPAELLAYPDPFDAKIDINLRAKTYLQVNCAMCHVSDGGGNSPMELGFRTPLEKAKIVNVEPTHETLGIQGAMLVKPGAPDQSIILRRVARRGEYQMPPTSTNRVDAAGAKLLEEWIRQLH